MTNGTFGEELFASLRSLGVTTKELARRSTAPFLSGEPTLNRLRAAVESLGQSKPARPLLCPEVFVQEWRELLKGAIASLGPRTVRYLCWDPDVASDSRFQNYLDRSGTNPSTRSLQGMVRACHIYWSPAFAAGQVAARIRDRLKSYDGPNRVVSLWKDHASLILGLLGAEEAAIELLRERWPIRKYCQDWSIDEQSPYVRQAVHFAALNCISNLGKDHSGTEYLLNQLLAWSNWPRDLFKSVVGSAIRKADTLADTELRESLKKWVRQDERLLDPRHQRNNTNWVGIAPEARQAFIAWLSRDDIVFFFEHVLPKGSDPHGRKHFWLKYVPRVIMSRPLLSQDDKYRLYSTLRINKEKGGDYGLVDGPASAFLLHFGRLLVVEFSRVGNACFVYDGRSKDLIVPDFWDSQPFGIGELKQPRNCLKKIIHKAGWQQELGNLLASFGIRES